MFHNSFNNPGRGLQTGVRMRGNYHSVGLPGWPEVINKAPGANVSLTKMRQQASNFYFGASV
jgi:hypothetical protein